MADNNLARSRNDVPDFFAEGDPLAELARIVGYEERVVARPEPIPEASVSPERREPVFNLEDELLREFERYDAPRLDPADDVGIDLPAPSVLGSVPVEPVFDAPQPVSETLRQPDFEERMASEPEAELQSVDSRDTADPFDDIPAEARLDDEEFGWVEPERRYPVEPVADVSSNVDAPHSTAADENMSRIEPAMEPPSAPASDAFDLAAELETSVVAPPVAQPAADVRRKPGFTPSFRMPLANFQSGAGVVSQQRMEPKVEPQPAAVQKSEPQPFSGWDAPTVAPSVDDAAGSSFASPAAPAMTAMDIPLAGPVERVPARAAASVAPVSPVKDERFSALDEILYDVDRYSTAARAPAPAVAAPVTAPATAPATHGGAAVMPIQAPAAAAPAIATPAVDDGPDPFADVEFELALDDLELDLADMVVAENTKAPASPIGTVQPPQVAPPAARPVVTSAAVQEAAPVRSASPAPYSPAFTAPAAMTSVAAAPAAMASAAAGMVQPRFEAPRANGVKTEAEDDVAFDPALIADADEQPEAIAELDVPVLPVEEKEEPPLYRNDFDLDIDAELASLLESPETVASTQSREATQAQPAAVAADATAASRQSVYADLDDFERALEEDFRRSLATPLTADDRHGSDEGYEQDVAGGQGRPSVRRWIAPLAAVGVVAICGAGAYAWLGSSGQGMAGNGEPIVIAADNDPVKVAPANPGGKTVPNQDKAVYDRVAGAASQAPRQQQLISSSEEPVDVVQKTLMPDTFSLEGENDVQMTEIGDTEDPRLLPQDQAGAPQASEQQAVAVMPRRVKTMVVRADGTLVEQETVVPASATEKVAAAATRSDSPTASSQSAAPFPTTGQTGAQAAAVVPASAPASGAAPVDMANAAPGAPQSVESAIAGPSAIEQLAEPASAAAARAPVPATRPAAAPAAATAASAPAADVPAAQNTQVASAAATAAPAAAAAGGYVIQIASLPSEADAQRSYQNLSNKFGSVIGGRGVDIRAAEIAGKGTFYRVRIPAGSNRAEAVALCERYRAAGGSCLVAR
jgi:hypothetical protein